MCSNQAEKTLVASIRTICSILCHHAESGQFYIRASMSVPKSDISSVVLREYALGSSAPDLFAIVQGVFASWKGTPLVEISNIIHVRTHREGQETSSVFMIADVWLAEEELHFISPTKVRAYKKRYGMNLSGLNELGVNRMQVARKNMIPSKT